MAYADRKGHELLDLGNRLFTRKKPIDNLNQEIAYQFAPDLASFTEPLQMGEDFMADHMDSVPVQTSRETSNQLSAMLRPQDKVWFQPTTLDDQVDAVEEHARFLQRMGRQVWRGIYDPRAQLIASAKEADRFYVNFGQAVLSVSEAPGDRDHLFFKNYHIRDCAWLENDVGEVDHLHRKQFMTARALRRRFGGLQNNLHKSIVDAATKEPERLFEIRVITMPADEYQDFTGKRVQGKEDLPYVICYFDVENCCVIRDSRLVTFNYVVPRWHRLVDSQYAFSPAAMTALPDARMAQMLAQILLEAGEKAIEPPLLGKRDVIMGEPNIRAGAITWVDVEHDAKLSEAMEALQIDPDMRVGFELRKDVREMLSRAFYLDKLQLPETTGDMTAFEIARRLEQHAQNLLPLFEPMQVEYNTKLLDKAFAFLVNMKKIDTSDIPQGLEELGDFAWSFESPIQKARQRIMVEQFRDTLQVLAAAKEAGLTASPIHIDIATRDAVRGVDGPAVWRKTQDEQAEDAANNEQMLQADRMLDMATRAGQAGQQIGEAGQKMGLIPPGGPLMPNVDQAVPSPTGVPQPGPTGSPTPSNAMRSLQEQLEQISGGAAAGAPQLPAPPANDQPTVARATAAGGMSDVIGMQRQIMQRIKELEEALAEPREIKIKRDGEGRVSGAKTKAVGDARGRRRAA